MSQNQRRSRNGNGVASSRIQPNILKSKKRKVSENDSVTVKTARKEETEMASGVSSVPLGDVTSSSLNVERERATTPDAFPEDWQKFRSFTCYPTPQTKRRVPLPELTWADKDQVWNLMCRKDKVYQVDPNYLSKHPALQWRMRAILLDWLTEVCEVYKLHRETYYLATAYIDRYLSQCSNTPKSQLQLIGITCLFIAAKIEEIYPPKLSEFSYVTDGACTDEEILEYELIILKGLQWSLSPVTSNCWLNTYLQLLQTLITQKTVESYADSKSEGEKDLEMVDDSIIFPRYSGLTFVQVSRLLDLCALDSSSLVYSPSLMAATALSYLVTVPMACMVSGYNVEDLRECHAWMAPLAIGIQELGPATLKYFNQVAIDDAHNIQTHNVPLAVLERALDRRSKIDQSRSSPPSSQVQLPEVLTPPKTDEKTRSS
ncbi:UNVERIFIED_CONTAM: hypothetical protein RMT77_009746 [Armadillidium vulgare]